MNRRRGFSLLEILLVLAIITTVSLSLYPIAQSLTARQRLLLGREAFLAGLVSARFQSLAGNLSMRVMIHSNLRAFAFSPRQDDPQRWQFLPPGVRFFTVPGRDVTFYSRGYAVPAGTFILENLSGQVRVVVSASGRIRWQELT